MHVHVYTMYVHGITSCLDRFSWPTERCRCRSEGHPSAVGCCLRLLSSYCTGTQWSTGKWTLHIHCLYLVYTCCRHVCTNHIQLCTLYIHVHVVDICNHVLPRWTQEQLKKVIAMLQDPAYPCMYTMVNSCMIALYIQACSGKHSSGIYMHTIHGTHVQCMHMYIHCMYMYMQCMCMF